MKPMQDNINPRDIFYIRKSGHGVFTLSIPPERLEEAARAMYVLMRAFPFRGKSPIAVDAIVMMAKLIEEDPDFIEKLRAMQDDS